MNTPRAVLLGLAVLAATAGQAASQQSVTTKDHAVLCASPLNLKEAAVADRAGDKKWLSSLSCQAVAEGIPGILIENGNDWVMVRVRPQNSDQGLTVYGVPGTFVMPLQKWTCPSTDIPIISSNRPCRDAQALD